MKSRPKTKEQLINELAALRARIADLEESEEHYRAIFENSMDGILLTGPNGRIYAANPAACRMLMRSEEEICRMGREGLVDSEDPNLPVMLQERSEKGSVRGELTYVRADGTKFPGECASAIFIDKDGRERTSMIIRDITEQKLAHRSLRESEERLRAVFEAAADSIFIKDITGRYVNANPAMEKLFAKPLSEIIGSTDKDLVTKQKLGQIVEEDARVFKGETVRAEHAFTIDGTVFHSETIKTPLYNSEGVIVGLCGIARNITKQKQAVDALLLSEKRFSSFFNTSPLAIAITRLTDSQLIDVNHAWEKITGFTREETSGRTPTEIESWVNPAERVQLLEELQKLGSVHEFGFRLRHKSGTIRDLLLWAELIELEGEQCMLSMAMDITERKQADEALLAERKKLYDVLNTMPAYIALLTDDYHLSFANRYFQERFGAPDGRHCYEQLFERADPCNTCESYTVLETGKQRQWEWVGPDGRDYEIFDYPFTDYDGSRMILEVGFDVTESKRSEAAIKAERQRLLDVFETLPETICLLTADYHVAFANRSFREKYGESHGRHCYEYCFGQSEPCSFCEAYEVLKTGKPQHWEVTVLDGSIMDVYDFPFKDLDGSPMILEMAVDITEHRRTAAELQHQSEILRSLSARLSEVEEAERKRIAEGLHCMVGQKLTALSISLSIINNMLPADLAQTAGSRLDESLKIVAETIESIRGVIVELRPSVLDDFGLTAAIRSYGDIFSKRSGITVTLHIVELAFRMPPNVEGTMFRIFEEALTNTWKHAQATEVTVTIEEEGRIVRMTIHDNGIGFEAEQLKERQRIASPEKRGWGLLMMGERCRTAGIVFSFESQPGKGTRIIAEVQ